MKIRILESPLAAGNLPKQEDFFFLFYFFTFKGKKVGFDFNLLLNKQKLQLINHGVSSTLVEKVKLEIEELFKLPMEEKKKYWQEPGDIQGFGQLFVVSEEQKLDWADLFYLVTLPTHMRKPNLFSKLPLSFRSVHLLPSQTCLCESSVRCGINLNYQHLC